MYVLNNLINSQEWKPFNKVKCPKCNSNNFELCINENESALLKCSNCNFNFPTLGNAFCQLKESLLYSARYYLRKNYDY